MQPNLITLYSSCKERNSRGTIMLNQLARVEVVSSQAMNHHIPADVGRYDGSSEDREHMANPAADMGYFQVIHFLLKSSMNSTHSGIFIAFVFVFDFTFDVLLSVFFV